MSDFVSDFAKEIEEMLSLRFSMGRSPKTHRNNLMNFNRFCYINFPTSTELSREIVLEWIEKRPNENAKGQQTRASAILCFGSYLDATGIQAYILPDKFACGNSNFIPYIFNDEELSSLFRAIDDLHPTSRYPFQHLIVPVLFRMIYTCGLRPREGRELLHKNIDFETGEILITETKGHKERIVVMSDDILRLCQIYEQKFRIFAPESIYFFPGTNDSYLSGTWINNKLQKCWLDANPGQTPDTLPRVRVYDLRHQFASEILNRWLDEKKDLHAILPRLRAYMGHSELSGTA